MSNLSWRGLWVVGLALFANSAAAVEFQRRPSLTAQGTPIGVQDRFGTVVAADGDTVAIAVGKRPGAPLHGGAVEIWVRHGDAWQRQAMLPGAAGALALHGDRLLVGAPGSGTAVPGEAQIYRRDGETWVLEARLAAAGGAARDSFGHAVALQDGRALIGAPGRDGPQGDNQGALYVFEQQGAAWRETARIEDPSAQAGELLGASVAWSGELALGGALGLAVHERDGQGAVLGFAPLGGGAWAPAFTLVAADGEAGDAFGIALAADEQHLVVGAHLDDVDGRADAGSARVFRREGASFVPEATLSDAGSDFGALGYAVSLSGEAIALGGNAPAPAVFRLGEQGWQRASAPEAAADDAVESVAISGATLAMGAPRADVGTGQDRGVAAIAAFDGEAWTTQALLTSDDLVLDRVTFGWDLAIDGGRAVVGAPGLCSGFCPITLDRGTAHFFERAPNGSFDFAGAAIGEPSRQGDGYAHAVALSGDRALVASGGSFDWEDRPAVELFERDVDGRWRRAAQLTDPQGQPLVAADVAIDGDLAAVGSRFDLHLFHREADGQWRHEARFPAGLRGAYAMTSLALQGNTLAIGIPEWSGEAENQGVVYVLERRDGRWQLDARLLGDSLPHVGFGDQLALHGDHLLVGEDGNHGSQPGGGVLAYERTAHGWESRGRLVLPKTPRWHAGLALRGDLAFAFAGKGAEAAVHAFEFRNGTWQPAGRQPAAGPRLAFDGETLLVSDFGLDLNSAQEVEVFSIRR